VVTLHYNNTLIVHPDTSNSFAVGLKKNLAAGRCRFGLKCLSCQWFLKVEQMNQRAAGIIENIVPKNCQIYKDNVLKSGCPGVKKQRECGSKEKSFGIDFKTYSAIADRTAWMYQNRQNKLIFIALTLPELKTELNENQLNEAFSRFIENLRENYHLRHYLAVREGDGINKRYHYHCIFDIRFTSFTRLNSAWCHSLSDFCNFSKNAFRTKKKSYFIRDVAGAVRYISKYVSKTIGEKSKTRIFFCDRETAQAWIKQRFDHDINDFRADFKTMDKRILNDYVCRITFKSKRDQNQFFNTIVKILFKSDWTAAGLYIFPDNPPG